MADDDIGAVLDRARVTISARSVLAARGLAREINRSIRKRVRHPRRILQSQDQIQGLNDPPQVTRMANEPDGATIAVYAHYERTRRAAWDLDPRGMLRSGLWVRTRIAGEVWPRRGGNRNLAGATGHYVTFDQSPRLRAWAEREDRGNQIERRSFWLGNRQLVRKILVDPAARINTDRAERIVREAMEGKS